MSYLIAALQTVEADIGKSMLSALGSAQPPIEDILTSLINEITTIPARIILVLDDLHLVERKSIHNAIAFLIKHQPPQLHLVISTREDPQLPLARLRARSQMTELRAMDLRFTSSEAAEFLNQAMGMGLSEKDITALENRTEGWIAGLQLAAISMQGQKNTSDLIKSFTGSHRFVLDYLIEEVLEQQPETVQDFLLQTAILNRLTGSLCDAVRFGSAKSQNSQTILEGLDNANLFIVPLDNERRWYRYHHLFVDLLRQRLRQSYPEQLPKLHLLASEWYEEHGLWSDAIRHAFVAKDLERVADLAELAWHPMNMNHRAVTWLSWVKALPDKLVRSRPVLSTGCGWASLDAGDLETAELYLQDAERSLGIMINVNKQAKVPAEKTFVGQSRRMVALEEKEYRSLSASIANGRAYLAQALGDITGTVKYAQRAINLLGKSDYFERGLSEILQGFAYWASGDLDAAYDAVADAISNMQMADEILFVISFTSYLADIMRAKGRFQETVRTYLQLLEKATEQGEPEIPETAVLHLGLSELYLEQGNIVASRRHLQKSEESGEQPSFAPWYRHWVWAHISIMNAQGDLDSVIEILDKAERLYYRHPIPDIRPLKAPITQAWLAQGKLNQALNCVRERGLSVDDDLSYLLGFEHVTLARLLIAQYRSDPVEGYVHDAMELLARLLKAAEESRRMGSVIEILALQALAYEAQSDVPSTLLSLKRALTLAEPEGYVQTFVGEGHPMARLLHKAQFQGISPDYARRLLTAFPDVDSDQALSPQEQTSESDWIEPLSDREIEVLQLVAEGLTNREIAARLYLSLNTINVVELPPHPKPHGRPTRWLPAINRPTFEKRALRNACLNVFPA